MSQPQHELGGGTATIERTETNAAPDTPYQVLLHNDPINLTEYVTSTLMRVLTCDQAKAENYMLLAHTEGKAAVFDGTLDACEPIVNQLLDATLWASVDKAGV